MTGFGQGAAESSNVRVTATLRAVNHRFLDLVVRSREAYRGVEPQIRERLGQELHRGRIEATIDVETLAPRTVDVSIDDAVVDAVIQAADTLAARGAIEGRPTFGDLVRLGEGVRFEPRPQAWEDADQQALREALDMALEQLVEARTIEGGKLAAVLEERLTTLEAVRARCEVLAAAGPNAAAENLRDRIAELMGDVKFDEDRLVQEIALLADRSDVREELDRLQSHIEHFRGLVAKPGAVGKRLDFLTQEVFRELNTIGSKCRDAEMTRQVLDGKTCCEQIREQVQNVE